MATPLRFLRFERRFCVPAISVERHHVALRRPGLRFYVIATRGIVMDSRAAPRPACLRPSSAGHDRPVGQLTVALQGGFVVRRGREQVFADRCGAADAVEVWDERWDGQPFRALVIEWDGRHGEPLRQLGDVPLTADEHRFFGDLADRVDRGDGGEGLAATAIERLRAIGLPLVRSEAMPTSTPPPGAAQLVTAAGRLLGRLDRSPSIVDLSTATALEERELRRRLRRLGPWLALHASWRAMLHDNRMTMAASLATAPGATLEIMALALGYGAPSAMLAAMRAAGLPPPSQIRALTRGASVA